MSAPSARNLSSNPFANEIWNAAVESPDTFVRHLNQIMGQDDTIHSNGDDTITVHPKSVARLVEIASGQDGCESA